jgi:hypothetical protein
LFSYQAIVSSFAEADSTSRSPSPSTSAANTEDAPSAVVVIGWAVNAGGEAPSFSCQAIVSSFADATSTSRSPSPSTSPRGRTGASAES